jgi:membrane protein implicated in regulation of membrane protease activity
VFFLFAALILGAILVLAGRGRSAGRVLNVRVGALVLAALATAGALATAVKLEWFLAAPLAALSAWLWARLVIQRPTGPQEAPHLPAMTDQKARALLGVNAKATAEEIQAAYLRLIRTVHPDRGGTSGLAAELNAARDRLLRR